jgi:N-acetylglucosaminyl-diphospho-decaprenol L-rhamnosyltransferase
MSDVDVIVLDLDGGAMLAECVESIRAQTVPSHVIVFDNGSRVPVAGRLPLDGVTILRSERNLGFAGGANAALRSSTAPYVALVNNDVVLEPDWLEEVHNAIERDGQLAAVQTIIRRPDGAIDGAGIDVSDGTFRQIGHGAPLGAELAVAWGVSATATLYRRDAVGDRFFEDRFFAYYEDVELSARLRAGGWRTAVLPVVKATHAGSRTSSALGRDALRLRTRNRYLVARMHRGAGRIPALLWEDAKLLMRGRSSVVGVAQGLFGRSGGK